MFRKNNIRYLYLNYTLLKVFTMFRKKALQFYKILKNVDIFVYILFQSKKIIAKLQEKIN